MPDKIVARGYNRTADQWIKLIEQRGSIGTWGWQIGSDDVTWSNGMFRLLGFDSTAVKPTYGLYDDLLHPEDRRHSGDPFALAASGALNETISRIIRPDGSLRWLKNVGEVIHARDGAPAAIVGVSFDITERELTLAENRRLSMWNKLAFDHVDGTAWARTPEGKLPSQVALPGRDQGDAQGAWLEEVHPDDRATVLRLWREAVAQQTGFSAAYRLGDANAVTRSVISTGAPIRDSQGRIELWVGITVGADISVSANETPDADERPLTPAQIRAARAFLGWSAQQLAKYAGVSFSTVRRAENPSERLVRREALKAIRAALESAGLAISIDAKGRSVIAGPPSP